MSYQNHYKPKMSLQNKSFVVLFFIATFSTCLAVITDKTKTFSQQPQYQNKTFTESKKNPSQITKNILDTSKWETYENSKYGLSFKIKPGWKVSEKNTILDLTILQIDPGPKFHNLHIYIGADGFYALEGLPSRQEFFNNLEWKNFNNMLFATKKSRNFFTFDIGQSTKLQNEFVTMVNTVKISY
jgi:hypothetical protein